MKLLADFLPILLFFVAFKLYDIFVATAVVIAATALQVGWQWYRQRRVERMPLITLGLIVVLGGATLLWQDETFIKWKPTVVNWLFAVAFLVSQWLGRKPLIAHMLGQNMTLPAAVWKRLNLSWVLFFFSVGVVNLYVAFNFATETWVHFKLFGMLGLTLAFVLIQGFYLVRHLPTETGPEE